MTIQQIIIELPEWLDSYANSYQPTTDDATKMEFVIEAARLNIRHQTGGPFAAGVFDQETGKLVALGVNLVTTQNLSMLHAEMVAIALAQRALETYDLGAEDVSRHELVTSTEPCAMCFGSIPWSGIRRVVAGATDQDARAIGFDEGPKPQSWSAELEQRGIEVKAEVLRESASQVLKAYLDHQGHIYQSRETEI